MLQCFAKTPPDELDGVMKALSPEKESENEAPRPNPFVKDELTYEPIKAEQYGLEGPVIEY